MTRAPCVVCGRWVALEGPLCDDCEPDRVRVVPRSSRVPCALCGVRHVTTARLPWCALSATAASQRPVSDASSRRSEGASQGK